MSTEEHVFTAEVQQLLNLMVHSLYSQKDIFLRELVSNSSDALDRVRLEGLTAPDLLPDGELEIRLEVDTNARTLAISDNGIGMSREEVVRDIGTIARSGSREFLAALKAKQATGGDGGAASTADLIGQFGVGFYSTFMAADRVTLTTRRAGTDTAVRWESTGDGTYTIDDANRPQAGTTVLLHLKPVDEEDGLKDYTDTSVLKEVVKKHSDFVAHPIRMRVERQEPVLDNTGTPVKGMLPKTVTEDETLNSMKAIWTRSRSEVSDKEYHEFYRHLSHDWQDPVATISAGMEGTFNARILLFIPAKAPFDLYHRDRITKGVQLYVKRVHVMDDWKALLPEWLRFLKGVIDCADLTLNVSREMLQHDRQVKAIRTFATKKTTGCWTWCSLSRVAPRDQPRWATTWSGWEATRSTSTIWVAPRSMRSATRRTSSRSPAETSRCCSSPTRSTSSGSRVTCPTRTSGSSRSARGRSTSRRTRTKLTAPPTRATTATSWDCSRRSERICRMTSRMSASPAA